MPTLEKSSVLKSLRLVSAFDPQGSPFTGVQLHADSVRFKRTSANGLITSTSYTQPSAYVSLDHFHSCLRVLADSDVAMRIDNGYLVLTSTDPSYAAELRVHSVASAQAGMKAHNPGAAVWECSADIFANLDTRPFKLATPPVLQGGRLMLATSSGIVFWTGPDSLKKAPCSPRGAFLNHIAAVKDGQGVVVTDNGYWGLASKEFLVYLGGHDFGAPLFASYKLSADLLETFPANRILYSLNAAASLCEDTDKIEWHPNEGLLIRDRFGNPAKFNLGVRGSWTHFSIQAKTAKLITNAIGQDNGDEVLLQRVSPHAQPTYRITRGNWEVNFRVF